MSSPVRCLTSMTGYLEAPFTQGKLISWSFQDTWKGTRYPASENYSCCGTAGKRVPLFYCIPLFYHVFIHSFMYLQVTRRVPAPAFSMHHIQCSNTQQEVHDQPTMYADTTRYTAGENHSPLWNCEKTLSPTISITFSCSIKKN